MSTLGTIASGRDAEPDPPGGLGRAQGGAAVDPDAARDAALADPPRVDADGPAGRRHASSSSRPASTGAAESVDDLVDFMVARCLDQLGLEHALSRRWGRVTVETGRLPAEGVRADVRPNRAGLRRDEPRHDRRARPALATRDGARGRTAWRRRARRVLRHRRPRARGRARGRGSRHGPRLLRAHARAGTEEGACARLGRGRPARAAVRRRRLSTRPRSASACATSTTSSRGVAELRRVLRPGGRLGILEITQPQRCAGALLPALVRPDRAAARPRASRRLGLHVPARERAALPGPDELVRVLEDAGFGQVRYRTFAAGIVALHTGEAE